MTDITEILSRNIINLREQQHLTQAKLATKSGICTTYIGEIETRRKYPSIKTLIKIADSLKVEPYVLLMDPKINKSETIQRYNEKLKDEFATMLQKLEVFR